MSVLRFQIQHANGRQEIISVESERALIGSGAHCEIRLPLDQSAVEHVLVQVGAGGVFVQALHFEPPPTIGGVPFTQAPLPPDALLGVGQTQMLVTVSDEAGAGAKKQQNKPSPVLIVAILGGLGAAFMLANQQAGGGNEAPSEVPSLFDAPIDSCVHRENTQLAYSPSEAGPIAMESKTLADSQRERRAFHAHDGIDAVRNYEIASACFRKVGDTASANDASEQAKKLRDEMDHDYRTHRLRLKHALDVTDNADAHHEAKLLLEMLQGRQGPYVDYLTETERRLKQQLGRSAS